MPKVLGERVYLTSDGKHVREGHPDAAFLAFALDDEVPDKVVAELGAATKSRNPAENKRQSPAADKAGTPDAGKADGDGQSGDGDPAEDDKQ